jgi:predicted nucleic acid-binding protein
LSRIYWDTMVFAYLLEGNAEFGPQTRAAYEAITGRGDTICTSVFTLGELLVLPKKRRDQPVISAITGFMQSGEVELLPFTADTAEQYSEVRAASRLKAADAIHVATAQLAQVNFFLTNDREIQKQKMFGIPYFVGLDGRLF